MVEMEDKRKFDIISFINLRFLRNPELQRAFLKLMIIAIFFISLTIIISIAEWNNTLIFTVLLLLICFGAIMLVLLQSYSRIYQEISILSSYSRKILNNTDPYDIRDNDEGSISILKNDIYKLTVMLNESRKKEQGDKEYLAQSIAEISHQLKTPLTSMQVMIELLKGELPESKKQEFLLSIEKQLERLNWITSALLKISKLDANTANLVKNKVRVSELVDKAIEPLAVIIELKKQSVIIKGSDQVWFAGDFNWSAEAITNILKNCVEHTQTGGTITISFKQTPLYTQISISDNGPGIAREDRPYVFKRFYKGRNSKSDSVGIGLAMSKAIIESQNGYIAVRSITNGGTDFIIKFYTSSK